MVTFVFCLTRKVGTEADFGQEENSGTQLTGSKASGMKKLRADAVAPLTRLAGRFWVKDPKQNVPGLTWTGLDVGGPCLEAFGMISENSSPSGQGRSVT